MDPSFVAHIIAWIQTLLFIVKEILGAYIIRLIGHSARDLANSSNKSELLSVYSMNLNQLYTLIILKQLLTVTLKR